MTQATLTFTADAPETFTDAVADLFRARPNQWIDAKDIMAVGGLYAWRTRLSDCRRAFGMAIENEWHTERRDGRTFRVSRYRWVTEQAA